MQIELNEREITLIYQALSSFLREKLLKAEKEAEEGLLYDLFPAEIEEYISEIKKLTNDFYSFLEKKEKKGE